MVWIPGGTLEVGSNDHYPEEAPAHSVSVEGFWMDRAPVTNAQYQAFVKATGHGTVAERPADPAAYPDALPELLAPSSIVFVPPPRPIGQGDPYRWWQYVSGADWRHPEGPGSSIKGRERHPVVHVTHADAEAYAHWLGKSLPGEAEWERAARGGLVGVEFAWGTELHPGGRMLANTWQGEFPVSNTGEDGYLGTAPVGRFPANGFGLRDMTGNVWEWTADWYRPGHDGLAGQDDPLLADPAASSDPRDPGVAKHVIKGGSFLCAPNYCSRYRPAAREAESPDTGTSHIGFRLASPFLSTHG